MLDHGYRIAIYSYGPDALAKLDLEAEIRDAREVLPESHPVNRYRVQRRYAMFANLFRLYLQQQGKGIWVDMDCLMLQPNLTEAEHLLGFASPGKLNNAVLRLPADCAMINDYISAVTADPLHTPWATVRRRVKREIEILLGRSQPKVTVRTSIGPRALTYFAKKHDVLMHALPQDVFYALRNRETGLLVHPDDKITPKLTSRSVLLHLWRGRMRRLSLLAELPPATSYLGQACNRLGIA